MNLTLTELIIESFNIFFYFKLAPWLLKLSIWFHNNFGVNHFDPLHQFLAKKNVSFVHVVFNHFGHLHQFFKLVDDDVIDERDLKIEKQQENKHEVEDWVGNNKKLVEDVFGAF